MEQWKENVQQRLNCVHVELKLKQMKSKEFQSQEWHEQVAASKPNRIVLRVDSNVIIAKNVSWENFLIVSFEI